MQLRRGLSLLFLMGTVSCASSRGGCGPDVEVADLDIDPDDLGLERPAAEEGQNEEDECSPDRGGDAGDPDAGDPDAGTSACDP